MTTKEFDEKYKVVLDELAKQEKDWDIRVTFLKNQEGFDYQIFQEDTINTFNTKGLGAVRRLLGGSLYDIHKEDATSEQVNILISSNIEEAEAFDDIIYMNAYQRTLTSYAGKFKFVPSINYYYGLEIKTAAEARGLEEKGVVLSFNESKIWEIDEEISSVTNYLLRNGMNCQNADLIKELKAGGIAATESRVNLIRSLFEDESESQIEKQILSVSSFFKEQGITALRMPNDKVREYVKAVSGIMAKDPVIDSLRKFYREKTLSDKQLQAVIKAMRKIRETLADIYRGKEAITLEREKEIAWEALRGNGIRKRDLEEFYRLMCDLNDNPFSLDEDWDEDGERTKGNQISSGDASVSEALKAQKRWKKVLRCWILLKAATNKKAYDQYKAVVSRNILRELKLQPQNKKGERLRYPIKPAGNVNVYMVLNQSRSLVEHELFHWKYIASAYDVTVTDLYDVFNELLKSQFGFSDVEIAKILRIKPPAVTKIKERFDKQFMKLMNIYSQENSEKPEQKSNES